MELTGRVIESGIDWLTCTRSAEDDKNILYRYGMEWIGRYADEGYEPHNQRWQGYEGLQNSRLFVGSRRDGACLRHSHGCSAEFVSGAIKASSNVSRLDVQVVSRIHPSDANVARNLFVRNDWPERKRGRQPDVTIYERKSGGSTIYIGSRSSAIYYRCYDKWAEAGGPYQQGDWRWEVELKAEAAMAAAETLAAVNYATADIATFVTALWARLGRFPILLTTGDALPWTYSKKESSNASRMRWIESSVRPAIRKLATSYTGKEITSALGL